MNFGTYSVGITAFMTDDYSTEERKTYFPGLCTVRELLKCLDLFCVIVYKLGFMDRFQLNYFYSTNEKFSNTQNI